MKIDPFKTIGQPNEWGRFGTGEHDAACDAERRAWCDHLIRRLNKGHKRGNMDAAANILSGGAVASADLFISAQGGPGSLTDEAFDQWIGLMTFSWYQAVATGASQT